MNLKPTKPQELKANADFNYALRTNGAFYVIEVCKTNESEVLAQVSVSREEKPEPATALEAGVAALSGYVARALAAKIEK